jgi:hypothetical protein
MFVHNFIHLDVEPTSLGLSTCPDDEIHGHEETELLITSVGIGLQKTVFFYCGIKELWGGNKQ